MDEAKLKDNLNKIIRIFNGHPHIFIDFLLKHNAFTDDFKSKLSKSNIQSKPKKFHDIEKAINFYSSILLDDIPTNNKEDEWNKKLLIALTMQKYEEAAKIRDYMHSKGYKIKI